jgi:hypothetical protein
MGLFFRFSATIGKREASRTLPILSLVDLSRSRRAPTTAVPVLYSSRPASECPVDKSRILNASKRDDGRRLAGPKSDKSEPDLNRLREGSGIVLTNQRKSFPLGFQRNGRGGPE